MDDTAIYWLSIGTFIFGGFGVAAVFFFGWQVFNKLSIKYFSYLAALLHRLPSELQPHQVNEAVQVLVDAATDFRERRNEFWTTYGQIVISIFVVTILAILLLTKTIEADAGLPILSGIAGFAIAKTVSTGKTRSSPGPKGEGPR